MESSPENSLSDNFNPFDSAAPVQGMGATGLVYEPLLQFDMAAPSTPPHPWLATAYTWGDSGRSITFTIRQGVKWNNGTPFTPADVAFTFNYVKAHSSGTDDINLGGLNPTSVTASGNTVTLDFSTPQYMNLEHIGGQAILPQSVWSTVTDPATFTDPTPVGTGPYVLGSYTPEGFTMIRNKDYWQNVPVGKVYFPDYTTNTAAETALFSGQIDWTGNYIPNLQQDFVNKDPATNHFFEGANSSNALYPSLTTWPTNQLAVRQAIDVALNRQALDTEGESGMEVPVENASGITQPAFTPWLAPSLATDNLPPTGSATQAASILTKAGYHKDGAGYYALNGREVDVAITTPGSYSDYANDVQLAVQSLQSAGIKASFNNVTVAAYNADAVDGSFQLLLRWGSGGITPYQLYDGWLDPSLIATGNGNYERLNDPTMTADLAKLNGDATVPEQTTDLTPIEQYVANKLPVIPTTVSAEWFEYSSAHFTGWPTQSNPYQSGQPSGTNMGPGTGTDLYVILHLTPVS
ncbi:MAG TPA: ABC transporter substrate-binding protein [Trebonia sp.]|jgi:peptide/nickel transport system substrate-binding protein|nr:ABC transporter substrate-binding protein [Trebonia sp.]